MKKSLRLNDRRHANIDYIIDLLVVKDENI